MPGLSAKGRVIIRATAAQARLFTLADRVSKSSTPAHAVDCDLQGLLRRHRFGYRTAAGTPIASCDVAIVRGRDRTVSVAEGTGLQLQLSRLGGDVQACGTRALRDRRAAGSAARTAVHAAQGRSAGSHCKGWSQIVKSQNAPGKAKVLAVENLSEMFGIEIGSTPPPTLTPSEPTRASRKAVDKAASRRAVSVRMKKVPGPREEHRKSRDVPAPSHGQTSDMSRQTAETIPTIAAIPRHQIILAPRLVGFAGLKQEHDQLNDVVDAQ